VKSKKLGAKKRIKKANESILGAVSDTAALGVKIPVQAVQNEPARPYEFEEFNFGADETSGEDLNNNLADPKLQAVLEQESEDDGEEYFPQKEFSPRQKTVIMYIGLISIMAVLVVFWGLSIKNSLGQGSAQNGQPDSSSQLLNQFQSALDQMKNEISNNINQIPNSNINEQVLNQLKDKLENLNANINANAANNN